MQGCIFPLQDTLHALTKISDQNCILRSSTLKFMTLAIRLYLTIFCHKTRGVSEISSLIP